MRKNLIYIILIGLILVCFPYFVSADYLGQKKDFFVEKSYDEQGREETTATLQRISDILYFYIDNEWWDSLGSEEQEKTRNSLISLNGYFAQKIYFNVTSLYGREWRPGIDDEERITVLVHPMKQQRKGYFRTADEYPREQATNSNEREMVYLNSNYITSDLAKNYLTHEFVHLITFNQKQKKNGVKEETWLNEGRAEYAPTSVGFNEEYEGSYLQKRVEDFLENSSDSITEWQGEVADYGALNLFIHYLVDHYGEKILEDSLKSDKVGISSINYALEENGFEEDFSDIFTDWTIAVLINDCEAGERYCYLNENLKDLKIVSQTAYLPLVGESTMAMVNTVKDWAGKWHRIVGGKDTLKFEFVGQAEIEFEVNYVVEDINGNFEIKNLVLDEDQEGIIYIPDFGSESISLTVIPSAQSKFSGFNKEESSFGYFWRISTVEGSSPDQEDETPEVSVECSEISFNRDLSRGMSGNDVKCLQVFLNGFSDTKLALSGVGAPGEETSYFGALTERAVIRFQEKYAQDILIPWGITEGTGYVGKTTRAKINELRGELESETDKDQIVCSFFSNNLYFGLTDNQEVGCLQQFLKDQGSEIYPEGLITGNFLTLTERAVIRFQGKYKDEILTPLGLEKGTGYVGPSTRSKINQVLSE